ncbi:hypothetical protein ACQ4PT_059931 [Festuca glaucescens]
MEVQQNQPPDFPSWVVLDKRLRFQDRRSFRADDETAAEVVATTGELVRVAFTLHPLPGSSGLRIYCPEEREESFFDSIVAAHGNAVLFRYVVDFRGLSSQQLYAMDYFLYRAGTSGHKLSLLPRCYSTDDEVMVAAAASDWRAKSRMWNEFNIGLLTAAQDFVVAELEFDQWVDSDAPLEADLFRLCSRSSSSQEEEEAGGQWELLRAKSRDCKSKASFRDVLSWETHKVVPFGSYLCWVDYCRGVLFCDVFHGSPDLQYKAFPVKDAPPPSGRDANADQRQQTLRTVCVTKEETMMFITVDSTQDTCSCKRASDFTIIVWKLMEIGYGDHTWVEHFRIEADELWAMPMNGFDHNQFPRLVPQFPLVSMDDPSNLYFVLRHWPTSTHDDVKMWIVTLNMESKTILRCDAIGAYPSDEPQSWHIGAAYHDSFEAYVLQV